YPPGHGTLLGYSMFWICFIDRSACCSVCEGSVIVARGVIDTPLLVPCFIASRSRTHRTRASHNFTRRAGVVRLSPWRRTARRSACHSVFAAADRVPAWPRSQASARVLRGACCRRGSGGGRASTDR